MVAEKGFKRWHTGLVKQMAGKAQWDGAVLDRIEASRRAQLPADMLAARRAWRDRRLMALAAHKREDDERIGS